MQESVIGSVMAWFLAGLLGGVHCLGMCGGLSAAVGMQIAPARRKWRLLQIHLGRVISYCLIGAMLGGLAGSASWLPWAQPLQQLLYLFSLCLIIALGAYLAGLSAALAWLERLGGAIWRRLQPQFARRMQVQSSGDAWLLGLFWGWLPCGLVYSAAIAALASASVWQGAAIMLAFGLGTLPNLLAMGLLAGLLQRWRQRVWLRQLCGGLMMAYGLSMVWRFAKISVQ